jgi:hypothetical protein
MAKATVRRAIRLAGTRLGIEALRLLFFAQVETKSVDIVFVPCHFGLADVEWLHFNCARSTRLVWVVHCQLAAGHRTHFKLH